MKLRYAWLVGLVVLLVGHLTLYGSQGNILGFLASYLFAALIIALIAWLAAYAIKGNRPEYSWYALANVSVVVMWGFELSVRVLGLGA